MFRNFTQSADRYTADFTVTAVDGQGNVIPSIPSVTGLKHGLTFSMPAGSLLNVLVLQTDGMNQGDSVTLNLQPYVLVATAYDIFHFYHEETTEVCWAVGSPVGDSSNVCILRSQDYFSTVEMRSSINIPTGDPNLGSYRSIYLDKFQNVIIGWRPGPMISRDGGFTFEHMFSWMDPDNGILCPFWNITEDDNGLMVISEYGNSLADTKPHGSHRGTFWSSDQQRKIWRTDVVDAGRDATNISKFGGYFRHIHGYHINPDLPHVHHMFLGDPVPNHASDGTPGYYVSQDGGVSWSDEIIRQWRGDTFYNGPCFVTWWPNGQAFIVSDSAETGHAYWWGSGPNDWGGPGFGPAIELNGDVDEESQWPETPWMAMAVRGSYETYCTTSGNKGLLWRYDADTPHMQVLAEYPPDLKWLSGSRHNRIPQQAKYFFTSGNRRFPRL
ncbi:MAG TPA: hypothetical protein VLL54_16340 [Pyrinomonadaceae bacterium]|nr:hypothetical protein [Pyrinomonadaceae bacterium]